MYNISDNSARTAYNAAVTHQVREFQNRVSFGHWSGAPRTFVSDLSFTKGIRSLITNPVVNSDSTMLTMGNACSASLKLDFFKPDTNMNLSNKVIRVESGLKVGNDYVYTPCGYFNISEFSSDDDYKTIKITGYDDMEKLSAKWNSQLTYPQTAKSVINEIATANCFSVEYSSFANTALNRSISAAQAAILTGYTVREVLGILAGIGGGNAFFNQCGVLCFKWFTNCGVEIPLTLQWQDGLKKTKANDFTILSVTSGIDTNVFTAGTGEGIAFINPLISQTEVQAIWNAVKNTSYLPCEVLWRGNPLVECGDAVTVLDKNGTGHIVFVVNQKVNLTGGFSQNVFCPTADGEINFQSVDERTQQALNIVRTDLQQAMVENTETIRGANGGYVALLDTNNDDENDTFIISSSPIDDPQHPENPNADYIIATYAGIGLHNGNTGQLFETAITGKGINADAITAGQISADHLSVGTPAAVKNLIVDSDFLKDTETWGYRSNENNDGFTLYPSTGMCEAVFIGGTTGEYKLTNLNRIKLETGKRYSFGCTITPFMFYDATEVSIQLSRYGWSGNLLGTAKLTYTVDYDENETPQRINSSIIGDDCDYEFAIVVKHESGKYNACIITKPMLYEGTFTGGSPDDSFPYDSFVDNEKGNVSISTNGIDVYKGAINVYNADSDNVLSVDDNGYLTVRKLLVNDGSVKFKSEDKNNTFYFDGNSLYYGGLNPILTIAQIPNSSSTNGNTVIKPGIIALFPVNSIGASIPWLYANESDKNLTIRGNITICQRSSNTDKAILVTNGQTETVLHANSFKVLNSSDKTLLHVDGLSETDLYANEFWIYHSSGESRLILNSTGELTVKSNIKSTYGYLYSRGNLVSSEESLKTNISPASSMLAKILSADIYNYDYASEVEEDDEEQNDELVLNGEGVEEVEPATPRHYGLVIGDGYNTPEEVISKDGTAIDLYSMVSIAWKAIQEQQAQIDALEQRIAALEGNA